MAQVTLEEDPPRMRWVLENFEQELLWTLNMADYVITETIEDLIRWRFDTTTRRAIQFSTLHLSRLSPRYRVFEGFLPLDQQVLDEQVKQALEELGAAGKDERRIRLVTRTTLMRTFNTAAYERYKAFGIQKYRWLAHATACTDPKELPDGTIVKGGCAELHGQEFPIDDEIHRPPLHPDCRCTIVPVLEEET